MRSQACGIDCYLLFASSGRHVDIGASLVQPGLPRPVESGCMGELLGPHGRNATMDINISPCFLWTGIEFQSSLAPFGKFKKLFLHVCQRALCAVHGLFAFTTV